MFVQNIMANMLVESCPSVRIMRYAYQPEGNCVGSTACCEVKYFNNRLIDILITNNFIAINISKYYNCNVTLKIPELANPKTDIKKMIDDLTNIINNIMNKIKHLDL